MKTKTKKQFPRWGFDFSAMNAKVRPQDDFYHYANGGWIAKTKIPPEEAVWGSFYTLRRDTEHKLKAIVDTLLQQKRYTPGSPEQMVRDYYRAASNMKRRNALGVQPLHGLLKRITDTKDSRQLVETIAYLHTQGAGSGWASFVDQDSKNSSRYLLHLWQGGLGMPERDYYLLDKPEQKRVRGEYQAHIGRLLAIAQWTKKDIADAQEIIMKMETRLARAAMNKEDTRDPEKVYHKVRPTSFLKEYCVRIGARTANHIVVGQPAFFKEVERMLEDTSLEDWKVYLSWHVINGFAGSLSEPFVKETFRFYSQALHGVKKMKPLWRRALASTNASLADPMGKLYVAEYFPQSAKRKMDHLVNDLFEAYAKRIHQLDWMSAATKKKALTKLRSVSRKIGYPKKWDLYRNVRITPDDYFGNGMRAHAHDYRRMLRKLSRPIDRDEWFMSPQTVNAYYAPNLNDIAFPAAILQWPFFDPSADDAVNYGAIGSVIGHEMTHAFDDSGAKFDHKGNMRNWWTAGDKQAFETKGRVVVAQADAHAIAPGITLSGKLTLGENIADLGGLVIAYDAYQKQLARTGRTVLHGLSPEVRFFLGFAQVEREISRAETKKMRALTDPHADAVFRINAPLSNFEPFYKAFGVKKGDALYRERNKRAAIW